MSLLTWDPALSVGVRQLDDDHKKLIAMINELHDAQLARLGDELIGSILRRLTGYAVEHFRREEEFFAQTHYPSAAAHIREHEYLKHEVMSEIRKYQAGADGIGMETLNFLRDWLRHHILECDKAYGAHLNAHGIN